MVLVFACDLADGDKPVKGSVSSHKKLGSAGLALHYANIITQIDTLVSLSYSAKLDFLFVFSLSSLICGGIFLEDLERMTELIPWWSFEWTYCLRD